MPVLLVPLESPAAEQKPAGFRAIWHRCHF